MEAVEYDRLDRVEEEHWFYRGKRRIARHWIEKTLRVESHHVLLDVGCGTGRFLREWTLSRALGSDRSAEAIAIAKGHAARLFRAELPKLPLASRSVHLVTALDVLEHSADDRAAFLELARVVPAGGIVLLTVPALPFLWSDWDEALHHYRRYTKRRLLAVVPQEMAVLRCAYINDIALLPVLAVRTARKLWRGSRRAEDRVPPRWLNHALEKTFVRLACAEKYRAPLGVSILLVARKTA